MKTCDVAIRDDDGYVYTIDRIKDMPILADENVYLAAIENVILAHPSGAVIGQPSDRWGESPLAVGVVVVFPAMIALGEFSIIATAGLPNSKYPRACSWSTKSSTTLPVRF